MGNNFSDNSRKCEEHKNNGVVVDPRTVTGVSEAVKEKRIKKRGRCCRVSDNFIIHGIDYLPESVKRKERRKNIPKFLLFDEPLWQNNPLSFFARFQNGLTNGSCLHNKEEDKKIMTTESDTQSTTGMTRSLTSARFSDEKFMDWRGYGDYPFQNIVMSGGGSKGYAYIGSLKALEDCGILKNISKVAGSSAGAICAGLLAVGCSPQEIADVFKCDIKWLFHDQTCTCCCCIPRVCNTFGIHPGKRFHEIYGEHLKKKVGNPDITFRQVKENRNRELCIVVTNLSRMCSEYLNHRTTPDLPIRDAVRMSMAFPVVFRAVRYNITGRECVYTDGGLLDQYPIHCFDGPELSLDDDVAEEESNIDDYDDDCSQGNELPNMATLGLYVVSEKPLDHKIWLSLFGKEIPCKPTYLPNTKLARERLEKEMAKRKMHNKKFDKQEFIDELCSSVGDGAKQVLDHYEIWNKSHVDIRNFGEYFMATLETLLISQRKLKIKANDSLRTVPINCGYIGTNDYVIEPGDREFMIDQGYTGTIRYLRELISNISQMRKKRVPRSRSSNGVERFKVNNDDLNSNNNNKPRVYSRTSLDDASTHLPLPKYFPPGEVDEYRGSSEVVAGQKLAKSRSLGTKKDFVFNRSESLSLKMNRNSFNNPRIIISNNDEDVRDFFRSDRDCSTLPHAPTGLTGRTEARLERKLSSLSNKRNNHHHHHCDHDSFSMRHDGDHHHRSINSSKLSNSLESEGYEELVCRTLSALDQSESRSILESRV